MMNYFNRLLKRSENNGSKSGDDFRKAFSGWHCMKCAK